MPGLWGRLAAAIRRPRAAGDLAPPAPDWFIRSPWLREAGVTITPETALQVSAVYACIRIITDAIASAPVRVYEIKPKGLREILHDDPTAYTLNWGASLRWAPDAPTAQAVEESLYWSALVSGNGYAEIQRDQAQRFVALWPVESDRVTPKRNRDGELIYEVSQPQGGTVEVEPSRMFHLRGPSLYGWVGDSPVYRAAKAVGVALAANVYSAAYFANGSILGGYLKTPKAMPDDKKKRFGEKWRSNYQGPGKAHGTPILDEGLEYVALNHDAQKSQLIEARAFQVREVARYFGIPTALLAETESWTAISELYLAAYRNAIRPWAERFDAEATRKLFPERQPWREVQHDLTHLVMGSFKDQVAALDQAVAGGLKTRNEARAILGDNTIGPDGDVLVVNSTAKTLEDVLDPPEPAPVAAPPPAMESPEDEDEDEVENLARAGIVLGLEAHARRWRARSRDVSQENLPAARDELRGRLAKELRAFARFVPADRLESLASQVEAGVDPEKALAHEVTA